MQNTRLVVQTRARQSCSLTDDMGLRSFPTTCGTTSKTPLTSSVLCFLIFKMAIVVVFISQGFCESSGRKCVQTQGTWLQISILLLWVPYLNVDFPLRKRRQGSLVIKWMIWCWILAQLLSSWVTWGKLLDFFEPHFSYLKIGSRIVFLAHSQHSIKVSYFYCLLGKKQCKRLSTLVPIVCCCNLSAFLCYISWIRESDWHSCLFILDQPMLLNPLVNAQFLF